MRRLASKVSFLLLAGLGALSACTSGAPEGVVEPSITGSSADLPGAEVIALQNPSFLGNARGLLDGWVHSEHGSGQSYTIEADAIVFRSSPSAGRISRHGKELYGMISQAVEVSPTWRGRTLRVSAFARSEGLDTVGAGGGALTIRADRIGGGHADQNFMLKDRLKGKNDWQPMQVELVIPEIAGTLRIGAMVQGGGTMWVDDFRAEILP